MVFLALTPNGLVEALQVAGGPQPVWCCATAITEEQFAARAVQPNLTRFNYAIAPNSSNSQLERALLTIEEHHPGQRIWVEQVVANV